MFSAAVVVVVAALLAQPQVSEAREVDHARVENLQPILANREVEAKSSDGPSKKAALFSATVNAHSPLSFEYLKQQVKARGFFSTFFHMIGTLASSFGSLIWELVLSPFYVLATSSYGIGNLFNML